MIRQESARALSDIYGQIQQVLLSFPALVNNPRDIHDHYVGLFEAFDAQTRFVILAQFHPALQREQSIPRFAGAVKEQMSKLMTEAGITESHLEDVIIQPLVDYREYHEKSKISGIYKEEHYFHSEWAQDPFVVLKDAAETYALLEPIQFKRSNINKLGDQLIAEYVAAQLDFYVKPFPFQLEGGNVLIGDTYAIIGSDILYKNWSLFDRELGFEQIERYFQWSLGVNTIIWVGAQGGYLNESEALQSGTTPIQTLPHIDMMVTLGGRTHDNKELVFVAELTDESCIAVDAGDRRRFNAYFQSVADHLASYDANGVRFHVERLPVILYSIGDQVFMPFNNCLTEMYDGACNVYLPDFTPPEKELRSQFKEAETAAIEKFESKGFAAKVVRGDFNARARRNGALHCISHTLKRSDYGNVGRAEGLEKPDRMWFWGKWARTAAKVYTGVNLPGTSWII